MKRYDTRPYVVTAERRRKAVALNQLVRSLPGGVLMVDHPFVPIRNGDTVPQAHSMGYWDGWSAGLGTDIFAAINTSQARWLLWNHAAVGGPHRPIGPYRYVRPVDDMVAMIGNPSITNALYEHQ